MRLLLDQGLARGAVRLLSEAGHDTLHVADIGFAAAGDAEILALAVRQQRVAITLDADFHRLLAQSGADRPSVIRIRREGLRGDALAALVIKVVGQVRDQLLAGAVVTVTERTVRVHRLPIL